MTTEYIKVQLPDTWNLKRTQEKIIAYLQIKKVYPDFTILGYVKNKTTSAVLKRNYEF